MLGQCAAAAIFPQTQMSFCEILAECDGIARFFEVNAAAGVPLDSLAAVAASHADQALIWGCGLWAMLRKSLVYIYIYIFTYTYIHIYIYMHH